MLDPAITFGVSWWHNTRTEMAVTDNDAYIATLARLRLDLALAEARVQKLKAGIMAIEELIQEPGTSVERQNGSGVKVTTANPITAATTLRDAAVMALDLAGRPLRTRQIYDLLMKFGYSYDKGFDTFKGSMTPTLDRLTNIFEKVDPGLYALAKWPKEQKTPAAEARPGGLLDQIKF